MTFFLDMTRVLGRILIDVRHHAFAVKMTIRSVLITGKVLDSKAFGSGPGNLRLDAQRIFAHDYVEETHVSPVFSPRVAHNPILLPRGWIRIPSHDTNHVIDHHFEETGIIDYFSRVVQQRLGVDTGRYGATCINLGLDFVCHGAKPTGKVRIRSIFGDRGIGEDFHGVAVSTVITGTASVDRTARCIHIATKAIRRVGTAGNVRLTRFVGDKSLFLNKVIGSGMRPSVTRTCLTMGTIQNILNAQTKLIAQSLAGNLQTIG
mmetsp:Transcript_15616/g.29834  ORF Transcript_15616/g.29834 Transcript_15616/m.29834 type:complete len:262 (-) Transcript_15616:337-1122(-)